jgi:methionyl-tRNA synthetase
VVNMVHKYFGGIVPGTGAETDAEKALRESAAQAIAAFGPEFDALNFSESLRSLWHLVAETDGYLTANAPWKKPAERSDTDHALLQARVLATAAEAIRVITALVYPILPESAAKVWRQLGQGEISEAAKKAFLKNLAWGGLKAGTKLGEPAPLFPRAEKDAVERMQNIEDQNSKTVIEAASQGKAATASPSVNSTVPAAYAEALAKGTLTPTTVVPLDSAPIATAKVDPVPAALESARLSTIPATAPADAPLTPAANAPAQTAALPQHISIDDFVKVDLRVAQILVAERVPKADKLLRLEVDLGYEKRQILAGIAQYYEPEKLIGRKIVIVANLAPRKMRGLESNGMLLAASLPDGAPVLAGFLEEVPLGARLK